MTAQYKMPYTGEACGCELALSLLRTNTIVEIILIGFTLMIFGIPVLLGAATFFIFIFGGVSAVVGTHNGKEQQPKGAEILFLASHPKFRFTLPEPSHPRRKSMGAADNTDSDMEASVAPPLQFRRATDTEQ